MEFSYSQTENLEMEKLSSDTGYFKKPVEINRGFGILEFLKLVFLYPTLFGENRSKFCWFSTIYSERMIIFRNNDVLTKRSI